VPTRNPFPTTAVTPHCDGYYATKHASFPPASRVDAFEVSDWRHQENTERVPAMGHDRFLQIISTSSFTSHLNIDTIIQSEIMTASQNKTQRMDNSKIIIIIIIIMEDLINKPTSWTKQRGSVGGINATCYGCLVFKFQSSDRLP
jgi:hypothetical protein